MSSLKQNLQNIRSRVRVNEGEARRTGAAMAGAFVLGSMEKSGTLANIPDAFGLPKMVTVAIVAKVAGSYTSGAASDYFNGLGDSASSIALYQFAKGETVAGMADDELSGRGGTAADLARRLQARLGRGSAHDELEDDAELAALEGRRR